MAASRVSFIHEYSHTARTTERPPHSLFISLFLSFVVSLHTHRLGRGWRFASSVPSHTARAAAASQGPSIGASAVVTSGPRAPPPHRPPAETAPCPLPPARPHPPLAVARCCGRTRRAKRGTLGLRAVAASPVAPCLGFAGAATRAGWCSPGEASHGASRLPPGGACHARTPPPRRAPSRGRADLRVRQSGAGRAQAP